MKSNNIKVKYQRSAIAYAVLLGSSCNSHCFLVRPDEGSQKNISHNEQRASENFQLPSIKKVS